MKIFTLICLLLPALFSCAGGSAGGGKQGQEPQESSAPINQKEELLYKASLIRCHKTGGSRVVKINGKLRCF